MKKNLHHRGLALISFLAVLIIESLFFMKRWNGSASIEDFTNSLIIVYIAIIPSLIPIFTKKWESSYVGLIFFVVLSVTFMIPFGEDTNGGASFEPLVIASTGFFSSMLGVLVGIFIFKGDA
jgi:hypothetical protein